MMASWQRNRALLSALALVLLAACGSGGDSGGGEDRAGEGGVGRIEGTVYYRERMMLPPGAEVEVQLQDISRPDALATVMASVLLTPEGGPPYHFAIEYEPARIDSRKRYALRATIAVGGSLMFASNEYIDPFAGGPLEVLVQRVPEPVERESSAP